MFFPAGGNGLGMTPAQAGQWLRFFRRRFTVLPRADLPELWQAPIEAHGVTGFRSHDVRLVAAMQSYGISRPLSFNGADFRRLPVTVLEPAAL